MPALIVVYKEDDEVVVNLFRKLIESNNDKQDKGSDEFEDSTIEVVPWVEKVWLDNKKQGDKNDNILFINGAANTNRTLNPIIDFTFQKYGISYGYAGKQALIVANGKILVDNETLFNEFEQAANNSKEIARYSSRAVSSLALDLSGRNIRETIFYRIKELFAPGLIEEQMRKYAINELQRMQLMYGITQFYHNDLNKFMNG